MSELTARENDALLILGVQTDTLPGNEPLLAPLNRVVDLFQARGLPIYAVRTAPDAVFAPDLGLPAFAKVLAMKSAERSAFDGTPLDFQVKMYGTKRLIVAGFAAICVRESVRDALALGFEVYALRDALAPTLMADLAALGAKPLDSQAIG